MCAYSGYKARDEQLTYGSTDEPMRKHHKKPKPDFSRPKPVPQEDTGEEDTFPLEPQGGGSKGKRKERTSRFSSRYFGEGQWVNLPLVVIVGRPNVGKSTLFNRLTHTGRAITSPTPGVTRDPVEAVCLVSGKPVRLVDTGGFKLTRSGEKRADLMDDLVVDRTVLELEKADRILLLLEAGDATAEDEELVALLRPHTDKLVVAVNKAEGDIKAASSSQWYRFGFRDISPISALHGEGLEILAQKITDGIDFSRVTKVEGQERPLRIAILGKPNTGKSTLSNALTHTASSIVTDQAGTTRDVVTGSFRWNGRDVEILDTAGIRRKARVSEDVEYYSVNRAIKTLDECDVVFLLMDATADVSEQDKKIASLADERGRAIVFALNKRDLLEDTSAKALGELKTRFCDLFGQVRWAPVVFLSAKEQSGTKELVDTAFALYEKLTHRVDTAAVNLALKDWISRRPPPVAGKGSFKIRYMTQTGVNPVKFTAFATKPEAVSESYLSYLKNRIRSDLGFEGIPVQLEVKASRKRSGEPPA